MSKISKITKNLLYKTAFVIFVIFVIFVNGRRASAQSVSRVSFDSVASVDSFNGENVNGRPQIVIDMSAGLRLSDHWQVHIRPWFRLPRPPAPTAAVPNPAYADWDTQLYQWLPAETGCSYVATARLRGQST